MRKKDERMARHMMQTIEYTFNRSSINLERDIFPSQNAVTFSSTLGAFNQK